MKVRFLHFSMQRRRHRGIGTQPFPTVSGFVSWSRRPRRTGSLFRYSNTRRFSTTGPGSARPGCWLVQLPSYGRTSAALSGLPLETQPPLPQQAAEPSLQRIQPAALFSPINPAFPLQMAQIKDPLVQF
jgi:hypothetical protein